MYSLPPLLGPAWMFAITGCIDEVMSAGCSDLPKPVTSPHALEMPSTVIGRPSLNVLPTDRSQRSLAMKPPPTSKRPPVSVQLSWQSQATRGLTYSGLSASMSSLGRTVSVRREPAMGAMVFTRTFFFLPSSASVFDRPSRPSFAIA